jgi:hypothetical protein
LANKPKIKVYSGLYTFLQKKGLKMKILRFLLFFN